MKTHKPLRHIFLVLVPHRDIRLIYKNYSECLFKQGFYGAFYIPWVVPLAEISRPFNADELKNCARNCARIINDSTKGDKIFSSDAAQIPFLYDEKRLSLYGAKLNISLPPEALGETGKKVIRFFSPQIIGTLLLEGNETETLPAPPQASFRAAATANMYLYPLSKNGAIGFKWKIGKLHWLPKERN